MNIIDYDVPVHLKPYVNCVMMGSCEVQEAHTNIPIYADGYPGIMFQQSENGFYILPHKTELCELFLFGQVIEPISLDVKGPFTYVMVQLYPFASQHLLGIDPKVLNDQCYNLLNVDQVDVSQFLNKLKNTSELTDAVDSILDLMTQLIAVRTIPENDTIQEAIALIIKEKGVLKIKEVSERLFITERTFERNFLAQVGLTPKQFARIIQFQYSLGTLTQEKFDTIGDVGYWSGFTDQSHFIKTFKKYTGKTPSYYLKNRAPTQTH